MVAKCDKSALSSGTAKRKEGRNRVVGDGAKVWVHVLMIDNFQEVLLPKDAKGC